RDALGTSLFLLFMYFQGRSSTSDFRLGNPEVIDVKDGGKDKVGEREVRVIEYALKFKEFGVNGLAVRLLVDPKSKRPLKREMNFMGAQWSELFTTFALDEEIADSEFVYQSLRRLGAARAAQLARSVELYQRFT